MGVAGTGHETACAAEDACIASEAAGHVESAHGLVEQAALELLAVVGMGAGFQPIAAGNLVDAIEVVGIGGEIALEPQPHMAAVVRLGRREQALIERQHHAQSSLCSRAVANFFSHSSRASASFCAAM